MSKLKLRKSLVAIAAITGLSALWGFVWAQKPLDQGGPYALQMGTAWYPEQWPEARWEKDLELMEAAHIHFVRVGEFAWSRMEPSEGRFDLGWLERAVRLAEKHHIYVVMSTPTATPPAWLTEKYPETLRVKEDSRRDEHGNRQQFDWCDPLYRKLAHSIAAQLAQTFGKDPNVLGWQIDNEYAEVSFSPEAKVQWHQWLRNKYKSIDELNRRWATAYWSETYSSWEQIPIETSYGNPGLLLNWKLFVSDTWRSYQKNQIGAIRKYAGPQQWITTNMMGWFDGYNHYTVAQDLDFTSWDDYVGDQHLDPVDNGARHDLTRGLLQKNFWVMETQPGFVNWHPVNISLDKGEVRAMTWHAIGHGAEAVSYWQWRSALNGQEEYHGTLVGVDGTPVPLYDEVAQVGREFEKAGPTLRGTTPCAEVAILQSYESRWAINWQRHNRDFDPVEALESFYAPLRARVGAVDIVPPSADLARYKLVVAPALNLISHDDADRLIAYVSNGGHLVLGQRTAMKDEDNSLYPQRQPGPLLNLLGGKVEQFYALDKTVPLSGEWGNGDTKLWAEQLSAIDAGTKVLMRYGKANGWLDGQPAAISRAVANGRITYIGAWLNDSLMRKAVAWMLVDSQVHTLEADVPDGVEVSVREGNGKTVWILVNLSDKTQTVHLPHAKLDVLTDKLESEFTMQRFDVAVLR